MHGYSARMLHVDLSSGQSTVETFDEAFARDYLGGNGFAIRLLYERLAPGVDPLAPENMIVFAVGPITDTLVPGATRCCSGFKSPLTGLFFDSTFGGMFAATQKRTGFEAIIISGRAAEPVYLLVHEEGAEIKPATDLWGKETGDSNVSIRAREGDGAEVLSIGPAGENLVRYACAVHTWGKSRDGVAGRGGLGAVMGSKNLKAVAVKGKRKTTSANPEAVKALLGEIRETMNVGTASLKKYGTTILVNIINKIGALGTHNLQTEVYDKADAISGETFKDAYFEKRHHLLQVSGRLWQGFSRSGRGVRRYQMEDARVRNHLCPRFDVGQLRQRLNRQSQRALRSTGHGYDQPGCNDCICF